MNCNEARDAMLVAEPSELDARGNGTLASHLSECVDCRTSAYMLSADLSALAMFVAEHRHATSRRRRPRRMALLVGVPVAAALIIALRLGRDGEQPASTYREARTAATSRVSVTVSPNQRATVIRTKDPKVTVIWLAPRGGP